jgi:hypothetical protein
MSRYGIAADSTGNLFFATGNSGPGTYDGVRNIQESVAKVDPQLVNLLGIFTPSIEDLLDKLDGDLSSGGVLLLPTQPGPFPALAVTAGKEGMMYLLNRASLGGFTRGGPDKEALASDLAAGSLTTEALRGRRPDTKAWREEGAKPATARSMIFRPGMTGASRCRVDFIPNAALTV